MTPPPRGQAPASLFNGMRGTRLTVVLNGVTVIGDVELPQGR